MSPFAIVIHLHIFKNLSFGFIPGPEPVPVNQFHFKRVKEALSNGIVPAIAFPAHAAKKFVLTQDCLEIMTGVLTAAVRMADQPLPGIAP